MKLHWVDASIVVVYLVAVVVLGLFLSKRAARDIDSYFLGGRRIPWYLLSVSNASGQFDITGTMVMVAWMFTYGVKSCWLPWQWPTFNQVFLMVFLAAWLRRSGVLTGAEWLRTRFSKGGLELSHFAVVLFALVSVVGFLAYAYEGIGKFAVIFLPGNLDADQYALLLMSATTVYVVLGGMYSVVLTDVIQFVLLTVASFFVAGIALANTSAEAIAAATPDGWSGLGFGWRSGLDWSGRIDGLQQTVQEGSYDLFAVFVMMALFKGILASVAGPAPNYDMQRVLATRSPRESCLMSGLVSPILYVPRYFLIGGITVLGVVHFGDAFRGRETVELGQLEQLLPSVINGFIPIVLKGVLLAGLLAAFMSTFDSTVNAGAAYLVNDVYKRYLKPQGSPRHYVVAGYVCSLLVVGIGIAFGRNVRSIDTALQWITAGLYGGYIAPNLLKWVWWRLNGVGYFAGMVVGLLLAMPTADMGAVREWFGAFLKGQAAVVLAYADDGGAYTDYSTEANEATGDDLPVLLATPAQHDAFYVGHATAKFAQVDLNCTTHGAGKWTITWEYWNGTAYTALSGVTDGTTGFTAATGWQSVTFTEPTDWAKNTVDGVNGYWIRGRVSAYTSVTTQPLYGQAYVVLSTVVHSVVTPLNLFPFIFAASLVGCIVGSLLTRPESDEVLTKFYRQVRPWGFWKPIHDKVLATDPTFENESRFCRDMVNCVTGIVWQLGLTTAPVFLLIRSYRAFWIAVAVVVVTSMVLKKNWYEKLEGEMG